MAMTFVAGTIWFRVETATAILAAVVIVSVIAVDRRAVSAARFPVSAFLARLIADVVVAHIVDSF
jgi:hypothetical protein